MTPSGKARRRTPSLPQLPLAQLVRGGNHVPQERDDFIPGACFQSAVEIHPQALLRDELARRFQQRDNFLFRRVSIFKLKISSYLPKSAPMLYLIMAVKV